MPKHLTNWTLVMIGIVAASSTGCGHCCKKDRCNYSTAAAYQITPLGTISDPVWQQHETNAEASDFVIHEHEWNDNTTELNHAGMDHVKQIAVRAEMTPFPIIVQQSSMTARADTKYQFPVHNNEELDMLRRELIVHALVQMGWDETTADNRVVVSPALTPGFESFEGEQAYDVGFGGGFGGFGGFGGRGFGGGVGFN